MENIASLVPSNEIEGIKCETVNENDESINEIGEKLSFTCASLGGVGLAAPQIGIKKRMFVMAINNSVYKLIINPRYLKDSGRKKVIESCLSYPNKKYLVKRYKRIIAYYQTFNPKTKVLEEVKQRLYGNSAIVFQHETDHCGNGEGELSKTIAMIGEEIEQ